MTRLAVAATWNTRRLPRDVRIWPAWMSIAATAIAACSLVACGGGESEPGATRSTTSVPESGELPPPDQRCRGGKTRPLELETVIEVGQRHGITLHSDPACQPDPTVVSQAANVVLYGPDASAEREREITQEEGAVTCMLREDAGPAAAETVERVRYPGDEETHFKLLNVDCVIYPEPENAEEQLRRLQATNSESKRRRTRKPKFTPARRGRSVRVPLGRLGSMTGCVHTDARRLRRPRISRAALRPGVPITPPPGWAAAPHRYRPRSGVR
jgi:hypothetical protein